MPSLEFIIKERIKRLKKDMNSSLNQGDSYYMQRTDSNITMLKNILKEAKL